MAFFGLFLHVDNFARFGFGPHLGRTVTSIHRICEVLEVVVIDSEDARLVKAAALRARGYQEVNPIARSWYLAGANELEGAFDPDDVLKNALRLWESDRTVTDALTSWRYKLDADSAGDRKFQIGVRVSDTDEELTLTLRNSTLGISAGIANGVDAVVSADTRVLVDITTADKAETLDGDGSLFQELVGYSTRKPKASTCTNAKLSPQTRT